MCHRFTPLTPAEAQEAIRGLREAGHARVPQRANGPAVPDAYPGKQLPLFVPNEDRQLEVAVLTWGFVNDTHPNARPVFNTRMETALSQAVSGKGMWASAIAQGRCLVPVRGFYEWSTKTPGDQRRQVYFKLPGYHVFLLAGVYQGERFSVMTTEPNADVAPIHTRMPVVLGPGESNTWLGPNYASLADRSHLRLEAHA